MSQPRFFEHLSIGERFSFPREACDGKAAPIYVKLNRKDYLFGRHFGGLSRINGNTAFPVESHGMMDRREFAEVAAQWS